MKRVSSSIIRAVIAALAIVVVLSLSACGNGGDSSSTETLKVGATPAPHGDVLKAAQPLLEEKGINLEIVEFQDYVQPNAQLASGELDANYFQHQPFLDDYNANNDTDLISVASVHFEPMGLYAGKVASLDELSEGDTIAVPNDTTNEARALLLLQAQGLIEIDESKGLAATPKDITSNPKNLKFLELDAAALPRALDDNALAVINANFALGAGIDKSKLLVTEDAGSLASETYANIIAVRPENKDDEKIAALIEAVHSDEVKQAIQDEFGEAVIPLF